MAFFKLETQFVFSAAFVSECFGDFCTFTRSACRCKTPLRVHLKRIDRQRCLSLQMCRHPVIFFRGADSCKELRPKKTEKKALRRESSILGTVLFFCHTSVSWMASDGDQSVASLLRLCQSVFVISARSQEDLPLRVVLVPVEEMCRTTRGKGVVTSKWGVTLSRVLIVKDVAPRSLRGCRSLQVSTTSRV